MDFKQQLKYTSEIEKYLKELVSQSTVLLTQAKEHQSDYDIWMNISMCAKQRWESYRYSTELNEIRRCQGELDSLNCALYMSQLTRKVNTQELRSPDQIVSDLDQYIQSIGLI